MTTDEMMRRRKKQMMIRMNDDDIVVVVVCNIHIQKKIERKLNISKNLQKNQN